MKVSILLRQARVHQWVKNALVLVPLLAKHAFTEGEVWRNSLLAALALSLVASATYILNDFFDLAKDRAHPDRRKRPLAAGEISVRQALAWAGLLLGSGLLVAALAGGWVLGLLLGYLAASGLYSWKLKEVAVVDTLLLSLFYNFRVVLGGVAAGIVLSEWLTIFIFFFFLSLAYAKRFGDITVTEGQATRYRRPYQESDQPYFLATGIACALLAIFSLVLYTQSEQASRLYGQPMALWGAILVLFAWTSRLWLQTARGQLHSDPVLAALRDPGSYLALLLLVPSFLLAQPL
ncbi:MAG: UbiA family prenyltransferase [Verrucomicrobiota bacterium]